MVTQYRLRIGGPLIDRIDIHLAALEVAEVQKTLAATQVQLRDGMSLAYVLDLQLQFAPEIHFKFDESVARAARIETLLAGIRDERPAGDPDDRPAD